MELVFFARQAESKFKDCFFEAGGLVLDAVARGPTEFCISGSQFVTTLEFLYNDESKLVRVPFPCGSNTSRLDASTRLLLAGTRSVMSSSGTNVDVVSGTAAASILEILSAGDSGLLIPISYAGSPGYVATVLIQAAKITRSDGPEDTITFYADFSGHRSLNEGIKTLLKKASDSTWESRTKHIVYEHAPTLMKLEIKTAPNCGVGGGDATFPGAFVNGCVPFEMETIDDLMGFAIQTLASTAGPGFQTSLLQDTLTPGLAAAAHAESVGTCLSILLSFVMVYRSDKSCTATSNGLKSTSFENWQQSCTRSALFAGDCEDGAKLVSDIVYAACSAQHEDLLHYPNLKIIRNTFVPYYMGPCIAVIGASAPSAEHSHTSSHIGNVAGHAAPLILSSMQYIHARNHAHGNQQSTQTTCEEAKKRCGCLFESIFNEAAQRGLPQREKEWLADYETARNHIPHLNPLVIEPTTPSVSSIRTASGTASGPKTEGKIERLGLDIPRTLTSVSSRGFYRHIVELVYPYRFHPEWKDAGLRQIGNVSNHFAVASADDFSICGVDPETLSCSEFALISLYEHGASDAAIIDKSVSMSAKNTMGRRATPRRCDKRRFSNTERSLRVLKSMDDQTKRIIDMGYDSLNGYLCRARDDASPPRARASAVHTVPYNAICENPNLLEVICDRIRQSGAHVAIEVFCTKGLDGCATNDVCDSVVATVFEFPSPV
jgi:hypothetical protein